MKDFQAQNYLAPGWSFTEEMEWNYVSEEKKKLCEIFVFFLFFFLKRAFIYFWMDNRRFQIARCLYSTGNFLKNDATILFYF